MRSAITALVPSLLLFVACNTTPPPRNVGDAPSTVDGGVTVLPTERIVSTTAAVWSTCASSFAGSSDPRHDLERLMRNCGQPLGHREITPVREGSQRDGDPIERFTFSTTKGKCYRVYAVGEPSIKDLDILARDDTGRELAGDASRDGHPMLPPTSPLCVDRDGVITLEVGVSDGGGKYVVQVWGS